MSSPEPIVVRSLRFTTKDIRDDLLSKPPLGIKSHLLHALDAHTRGDRDVVMALASRAYQLGYEHGDPIARADAERILNAAGFVVG